MKRSENINRDLSLSRPLKVYAFDPGHGRNFGNYTTLQVRYEKLQPGPIGERLAVLDYDASNRCYYQPVNLDDSVILLQSGLDPSESDAQFHQQMVYAVASETIKRFEFALGRRIKWGFSRGRKDPISRSQLRIFPHGMQEPNAYYSRELRALVFGYFSASDLDAGSNLPGQMVFTCLSHDIIVHETTHAIVDGLRRHFLEATNPDTPAFHEAFADIVALFQHFTFREPLLEMIHRTGGQIHRLEVAPEVRPSGEQPTIQYELSIQNPMVELAKQFGEAMGLRAALRAALGTPPNSKVLEKLYEPHARGSILVAAVFDAFFTVYLRRTRDLMRMARTGGALNMTGDLHPDLVSRLAREAVDTAAHFLTLCIRSLDYCPPVDITFGDFLRALITASFEFIPDDEFGYRNALIDAFRSRGIRPDNAISYSEEALRWNRPETGEKELVCEGLTFDLIRGTDQKQLKRNAIILSRFGDQNRPFLGLSPNLPVQAHSFHPLNRVNLNDQWTVEIVVELLQQREELLDPKDKKSPKVKFRGGTTLVLDRWGNVRYAVSKSLEERRRLERQRDYYLGLANNYALSPYFLKDRTRRGGKSAPLGQMDFCQIHRGY